MIRTYKIILCLFLFLTSSVAAGQNDRRLREFFGYRVVGLEFTGLNRTNPEWLRNYLGLTFPTTMTADDAILIERKLLTTAAFTEVEATYRPTEVDPKSHVLVIDVTEKWTAIPVIRGVYGGGTPLYVLGGYDIHTAGRLWTVGAEARKYGNADPGYVVYFRDPRHAGDRFFLGAEFWRMFRIRDIFTDDGVRVADLTTNEKKARINVLAPLTSPSAVGGRSLFKYGLDLSWIQEAPATYAPVMDAEVDLRSEIGLPEEKRSQTKVLATLVYDDVDIDNYDKDGLRVVVRSGPAFAGDKTHATTELDAFYYKMLGTRINAAAHLFVGGNSSSTLQNLYFLGGFDSIRGLPDGVVFGKQAAYTNLEVRHMSAKWKYLWLQNVVFYDEGLAGERLAEAWDQRRSAVGFGVRMAVPQVHRLMLRIDYARSVDGSGSQGFSAGLNHFFQPYRPL